METGKVKTIVAARGFGFISREGEDNDLFFHMNSFDGVFEDLKEGDELTFEVENGEKGPSAVNVKKA